MTSKFNVYLASLIVVLFLVPSIGGAITPEQLYAKMKNHEKVVIVDIRSKWAYQESHIPGAINIPASVIPAKKLAPMGDVVVYGDGVKTDLTRKAVDDLNLKEGINADMLEGGFGAWRALNLPDTRKAGVQKEKLKYISYRELVKAASANPDVVLVDLRMRSDAGKGKLQRSSAEGGLASFRKLPNNYTDLSKKFPDVEKIDLAQKSAYQARSTNVDLRRLITGTDRHYKKLYVLIDNGDGTARKIAHKLKAAGVKRIVILVGGERSLETEGQPGLKTIEIKGSGVPTYKSK